ncbi:MAG: IS110 family transposase [Alteromonas sp.]|nr:IS110 family transposase [Alteromonas sp.]
MAIKKSMGLVRGKDDATDALRIALYASRFVDQCRLYDPPQEVVKKLEVLLSVRKTIQNSLGSFQKKLKEAKHFDALAFQQLAKSYRPLIRSQKKACAKLDKELKALVASDEQLHETTQIATSVEGVGMVTASMVVVYSNEFKRIGSAKKMACFAGVAPFSCSSGSSMKGRTQVSKMAHKPLKAVLHMAAIAAAHGKGELALYYQRKVGQGKHKMSVLNAVRNKIIHRLYACVRNKSTYEKRAV